MFRSMLKKAVEFRDSRYFAKAFAESEYDRMDREVVKPLAEKNKALQPLRMLFRKGLDPVVVSTECGIALHLFKTFETPARVALPLLFHSEKESLEFLLDNMHEIQLRYQTMEPKEREAYQRLTIHSKEIAREYDVDLFVVSRREHFRNEIYRRIFPKKDDAKNYIDEYYETSHIVLQALPGFRALARKVVIPSLREEIDAIPDAQTSGLLLCECRDFLYRRLEEIY